MIDYNLAALECLQARHYIERDVNPMPECAALTIAEGLKDLPLRVAANYNLGTAYFVAGEYRHTDEYFSRVLKLLEGNALSDRCGLAGFPAVVSRYFWTLALTAGASPWRLPIGAGR
jgi:hypothetical protein